MTIYSEAGGRSHHFLWVTVDGEKVDIAILTKDNIYPPDFVAQGSWQLLLKFWRKMKRL
jgi:hypothetical protein